MATAVQGNLADIIGSLRKDPEFSDRVTHWEVVPAREGKYADIPSGVDARIRSALALRGIGRIYSHQLSTWNEVRAGRSVVLVSPTASGMTAAQIQKLQKYYADEGCEPDVVAADVVRAVEKDAIFLFTGPGAKLGFNAMRLSRRLARKFTIDAARKSGYLAG